MKPSARSRAKSYARTADERTSDADRYVQARGPTDAYFHLLEKSVAAGNPHAMADYGMWLLEGKREGRRIVLPRSPSRAVHLLRKAAAAGSSMGQLALADCLSEGAGTRQNISEAVLWYRRAARRGLAFAALNLATVYRDRAETAKERYWLKRADHLGAECARLIIAEIDLARGGVRARAARAYLTRKKKASSAVAREEAIEILANFERTGRRRWSAPCDMNAAIDRRSLRRQQIVTNDA